MRVGILTGGGDCPGLNPAIRGATLRLIRDGHTPIGILQGWKGLIEGLTVPLTEERVDEIIREGGTILGTSRTNPFKNPADVQRILDNIADFELGAIIAIGGEDTLGVAQRLYVEHGVRVVGVPKTMDNDLGGTDFTFGFDSAVSVAVDAMDRLRDTAKSHARIIVLEVMGRYAGWVALYAGIAGGADWILIPEVPVDLDAMCDYLKRVYYGGKRYGLVVVSEGVKLPFGEADEAGGVDEFGHRLLKARAVGARVARYIEEKTGIETRDAVIGHIQRGGPPTAFDRVLATRLGIKAAELVSAGQFGMMAAVRGMEIVAVPLEEALRALKLVPHELYEEARQLFQRVALQPQRSGPSEVAPAR
ncbi:MAG: 6-phosphofructokinase [Fimbriimonadales bacterium]|nr:6-phosphofructokinase [Fimbriimonadales bacterium]MDW8051878.1 ATP-dependent 6-phosphofructokinase [Armatimonadota bacterium]